MAARRVLISIDERLLQRIDRQCERLGVSRSAYLAQVASERLAARDGPGLAPAARAALRSIDELLGGDVAR